MARLLLLQVNPAMQAHAASVVALWRSVAELDVELMPMPQYPVTGALLQLASRARAAGYESMTVSAAHVVPLNAGAALSLLPAPGEARVALTSPVVAGYSLLGTPDRRTDTSALPVARAAAVRLGLNILPAASVTSIQPTTEYGDPTRWPVGSGLVQVRFPQKTRQFVYSADAAPTFATDYLLSQIPS